MVLEKTNEEMRTTTNMLDDPFHTMESADGGDSIEYALSDTDMELKNFI